MPATKPRLSAQQRAVLRGSQQSPERRILYVSHDGPQSEFLESEAEEVLYGGSYAGGKSWALRAYAVRYAMTYPGAQVWLFRRSYRELTDTYALAFQQELPQNIASYSAANHTITFFANGSTIFLRYCEQDADIATYQTSEFDCLLIDEVQQFSQYRYTGLLSRVRSSKSWWPGVRVRAAATPGDIGHQWVKSRWIDPAPANETWQGPVSEGGLTRQFIPARVTDNPTLMKSDPQYLARLRALSEEEYRMKALGDWDIFSGQFFSRWRPEIHVIEPFDIPPDWDRFVSNDYGFNAPFCTLWGARPPGTRTLFIYREHYGRGVSLDEQVYRARQVIEESGEKIRSIILDASMFSKVNVKGERIDSMATDWQREFRGLCPTILPGDRDRVAGWRLLRELIDWKERPDGGVLVPPKLYVFRTCSNLARTIPIMVADKNNPEDLDTEAEDHSEDALRYMARHVLEGSGRNGHTSYRITPRGLVSVSTR